MFRLTIAQMRRSAGRLAAAGLAIAIGTAFVAATLLAGAVITRTSYDALAASYADADFVVSADRGLTASELADLRSVAGVAAVDGRAVLATELSSGARRALPQVTAVASDPRLEPQSVVEGRFPTAPGEVALPGPLAERLGVAMGEVVTAHRGTWAPPDTPVPAAEDANATAPGDGPNDPGTPSAAPDGAEPTWVERPEPLTVVGLTDDPAGAFAQSGGAALVTADELRRWATEDLPAGEEPTYQTAVLALAGGVDPEQARSALAAAAPGDALVRTKDEEARAMTAELADGSDLLLTVVLGFAAVALVVAGLVIANTFAVLIAQRTQTLALLRCVGAESRQLRRSVLLEAGVLGLLGSLAGLALGVGVGQAALWVLGRMTLDVPLPTSVTITPAVVLAPLIAGTAVTVLACLAPARAATRVAPLAALRPADVPALTARRNRPRLVLATLMTLGGTGLLVAAVTLGGGVDPMAALAVGVLGGAVSFVGVLVGAVFWLPRVVGLTGRVAGRVGPGARLAAANTVRNPRRTAATSTALLIGVTLVTMMSTGAASARVTLEDQLDAQYPVDVAIGRDQPLVDADGTVRQVVTPALVRTVEDVPGVERVLTVPELAVTVGSPTGGAAGSVTARVVDAAAAAALLRTPAMVEGLTDDTVVVAEDTAADLGLTAGDSVTLAAAVVDPATGTQSPDGAAVTRTVVVTALPAGLLATPATLAALDAEPVAWAWARLDEGVDPSRVVPLVQDALVEDGVQVAGAAVERAMFEDIIDTLLAVVVGLLAVAVVIAVIGVANTLSLSVIERRRESATLRVIGLSRRQLRGMLALEGLLIAGVGAVLGVGLGIVYGWAGAATVLGVLGDVRLDVPWRDVAVVLAVAAAAGLLASVLPGRAAARTSPVAALAVD